MMSIRAVSSSFAALLWLLTPSLATAQLVIGTGAGTSPLVRHIDATGAERMFFAYDPAFVGGVHVALGDINGDGILDIITGPGPGITPLVRVFNGVDLSELTSFVAYPVDFFGGVYVAAGDVNGDGRTDIITGAGPGGGPHVRVWSGIDLAILSSFYAYPADFPGGVSVAAGDVNGDGRAEIITGAGPGGGPHLKVLNGTDLAELVSGYVYPADFLGGLNVAAGDVNGDGFADIITGAGPGGGPHVRVLSVASLEFLASFYAYDAAFSGGVAVAAGDFNGDNLTDIVTGAGPGGSPHIRILRGTDLQELASFFGTDPAFGGGVFVGSIAPTILRFTSANTTAFTVASPGTFTVTTAGPTPTLTVTGTLPAGVTFVDNGDGTATLAGTPQAGSSGSYPLTFTATRGSLTVTQAFTLTVNQPPAITSANATTFTVGVAGTFTVTTTGFPTPQVTAGGALPAGVTFMDNGNGTATLAGTPQAGTSGSYPLTISATNGVGAPATQAFTLSVNDTLGITSANATTFVVGVAGSFTVTTVGTPTPTLVSTGTLPAGVTFVDNGNGTATLAGTPAAGTGGVYALMFTAANAVATPVTQNFTLTVQQAPAITSANATIFTVGLAGSFTVTTTGFPVPTITQGGVALPTGVTFVDNGNGTATLSGTPAAGTGRVYAIAFTAANGIGTNATQNFTLTINEAPAVTSANSTAFSVGVAGTFTVTTTGFPVATIARTGAALPSGVTFVDNGNGTGTLSGTPAAGTAGAHAITFTAANGVPPDAVQTFTLNVRQPPAITSANATTFTVGAPGSFTVTTTGFPTPTVAQSGTLPAGVTFTPGTNVLGGIATQTGTFNTIQFTATNGVPPDAVQNFTLTVVCPAITVNPAVLPDGLYQVAYGPVPFTASGSTGATFTWGATGLPAGVGIDVNTGILSGTPTNTVLNGAVAVTVTDNFGCQGTRNLTITVRPTTDNENYLGGVGNTQYNVGAAVLSTPNVFTADNVKTGDNGPGTLSVTFPATAMNGTIAEGATDGTFIYTPNVNFAGPSDTFTYTLTDGNGVTNTGTVTINLSNLVWYVNSNLGNGDGRSHSPFNSLANAAAPSASNSVIYVHTGVVPTPGNLAMDANQTLFGQGATFMVNGLTIPAGTRPTLTGTVTLANNTTVTGVNFTPSGIPAMTASAVTQPVAIDQVNVTGGTNALSLTNVSGAVAVTTAMFTNTSGAEVLISGGTGAVSISAVISSNAGRSIDVQGRTTGGSGAVTFTGAVTDTGAGIFLDNNDGSAISFSGGLALSTGTNPAFTATNGGTINVCDENPCNPIATGGLVNVLTTTTATALNVAHTTIGANNLEFRAISSSGGSSTGIILDTTGSSGGLKVKGTGTAGSGGTIANKTGADGSTATGIGFYLNNTSSVSIDRMQLNDFQNFAIRGFLVNGFSMSNTTVTSATKNGTSDVQNEGSITFGAQSPGAINGLTGTAAIVNSLIEDGFEDNFNVFNASGSLTFTMSSTTVRDTSTASPGNNGLQLRAEGTANMTATIIGSTFVRNRANGIQVINEGSGTVDVTIGSAGVPNSGGTFDDNNIGINIAHNGAGSLLFDILNATLDGLNVPAGSGGSASPINLNLAAFGNTMSGTVSGNVLTNSESSTGPGIRVIGNGAGTLTVHLTQNNISQVANRGIEVIARDGSNRINATITNNTVTLTDPLAADGIRVDAGVISTDTTQICAAINGNTATTVAGVFGIRVRQRFAGTTFWLANYAGSATDNAAVQAFLSGANNGATTSADHAGAGFQTIGSCPIP